jgi:hypothetical protein
MISRLVARRSARANATRVALALASVCLSAPGRAQTTRDSAGVHIIENPSRLKAPATFRLGPPVLDVGGRGQNPDDTFQPNQAYLRGVRMSDGGMAVIDVARIHYFDAAGKRLTITGRRAGGADDFQYLTAICRTRGDTIVVGDLNGRRFGVLDKTGAIVRMIPQGELGFAPFNFCFDDGTFVVSEQVAAPGGGERQVRMTRVRLDGSVVNRLSELPGGVFDLITTREVQVVAWGQRLYFGDATTSQILVMDPTGKLVSILRTDDPPTPVTNDEVAQRVAASIPPSVPPEERAARIARMQAAPRSATWPAYGRMHVDPSGRLWVQDYVKTVTVPNGWTAFDSTGTMVGRFVFPAAREGERLPDVIGFGVDQIILRHTDADGAHLTVYAMFRAPGGQP